MENTIRILKEKMHSIQINYLQGYDNGPIVGLRSEDAVIVDNICWLIAGDITIDDSTPHLVTEIDAAPIRSLKVSMTAQALVYGCMVRIDLGNYAVGVRQPVTSDKGWLKLI